MRRTFIITLAFLIQGLDCKMWYSQCYIAMHSSFDVVTPQA